MGIKKWPWKYLNLEKYALKVFDALMRRFFRWIHVEILCKSVMEQLLETLL